MRILVAILPLLLIACGDGEPTEEERRAAVEEVEAAQAPPPIAITPDAITFADIEEHDLFGAGCYVLAENGEDMLALAGDGEAYIKVDGKLERLAADMGSAELPWGIRASYDGTKRSVEWAIDEESGQQIGEEVVDYPGQVTIRDSAGSVVWTHTGKVQCGA